MSDLESQEDELLSLQSIFQEKEFSVDGMNPPSGRITIEVRLPDGFYVAAVKGEATYHEDVFQVEHLPPINLFFQFPDSYPRETCPTFFLSCDWLNPKQLSLLCKKLESLWERNKDVILYNWIQFLQEEALEFLKISQCLDISDRHSENNSNACDDSTHAESSACSTRVSDVLSAVAGGNKASELGAFNEFYDSKLLIQILKEYNEYKKESIFHTTLHVCSVCLLRKLGSEFIKFNCNHFFCKDCVKEYFEELIKDGSVNSLKCLQGDCDKQLNQSTIKGLVRSDLYERYERLLLSSTLEGMSDIAYCPRQDCQCACIIDTCGRMGTCNACYFVFCPFCKMTYHGVAPCNFKSEQRKNIFKEYINGSALEKEGMEKRYGKRMIRSLVEDTLSENWKSSNSKSCPHCRSSIEKTNGCNKMTCFNCGSFFCWLCMKVLNKSFPYRHYSDAASECFMLLFPEDDNDEIEFIEPGQFLNG